MNAGKGKRRSSAAFLGVLALFPWNDSQCCTRGTESAATEGIAAIVAAENFRGPAPSFPIPQFRAADEKGNRGRLAGTGPIMHPRASIKFRSGLMGLARGFFFSGTSREGAHETSPSPCIWDRC